MSSIKLSDTDGFSYVLVNGVKTKDSTVDQNDSSMFNSSTIGITATIARNGGAVAANADELEGIAAKYAIKLVASNNAKMSFASGAVALAAEANSTLYITFEISDGGVISALSDTVVYAGVQGESGEETSATFTTNKPTVTATLGTYTSNDGPAAAEGGWTAVSTGA